MKKILLFAIFVLAFVERVFIDLGPNVELVTLAMLASAAYLNRKQSLLIVSAIMILSDIIIGNSSIFVFTWTGFLIPLLFLNKFLKKQKIVRSTFAGAVSNLFFYVWTNFGVWLIGSMYPHTALGLMQSYINGLPFLKLQLISTLLFVPFGFLVIEQLSSYFDLIRSNISFCIKPRFLLKK